MGGGVLRLELPQSFYLMSLLLCERPSAVSFRSFVGISWGDSDLKFHGESFLLS